MVMRDFVPASSKSPTPRDVQYANHDGEHITAFPQRVVPPAGGGANNKRPGRHMAAPVFSFVSRLFDQFGTAAFGFGGNAALLAVPRNRSSAILIALSSDSFGGM
jgi:hypothetical protein